MKHASTDHPFPGLRSFEFDDREFFFGREEHIRALYEKLLLNRFVAVVGSSGSGKSSLVRAGILGYLSGLGVPNGSVNWKTILMRPFGRPLRQLGRALVRAASTVCKLSDDERGSESSLAVERAVARLSRSSVGLADLLRELISENASRLLIIVDQFEELFRYAQSEVDFDERALFVKHLLRAAREPDLRSHILITMRSEFIGDCAQFRELPEAINDSQFLTPRLTRDQRKEAILGPLRLAGAEIAPALLQRILNDIGREADQLPIMQHALMRTWLAAFSSRSLTLEAYEAIGGMESAISIHGEELLQNRTKADETTRHRTEIEKRDVERIFRALTDVDKDGRTTRRPMRFVELAGQCSNRETAAALVDTFREEDCAFLSPNKDTPLDDNTIVDITHEALIRKWKTLAIWVDREVDDGKSILRLHDLAARWKSDPEFVLAPREAAERNQWWQNSRPTAAWARRYLKGDGVKFEDIRELLDASNARGRRFIEERLTNEYQKVLRFLAARDYEAADIKLCEIADYLKEQPDGDMGTWREIYLARRRRVRALADFYVHGKRAFSLAGEEDFERARGECKLALSALGWSGTHQQWWQYLPIDDLDDEGNIKHLKQEAYRTLLMFSALQLVPGIVSLLRPQPVQTPGRTRFIDVVKLVGYLPPIVLSAIIRAGGFGPFRLPGRQDDSQALWSFRTSHDLLLQVHEIEDARAAEKGERSVRSRTSSLIGQMAELLEEFAGGPKDESIDYQRWLGVPAREARPQPVDAVDYFFIGLFNFVIAKRAEGIVPKVISLLSGRFPDLDGHEPLRTAERLLRMAVALDPQFYWPHWVLGRTLQTKGDYGGAELAFNAAIALDPYYARGYEQRALTLGQQWRATNEEMVRARALQDSQKAEDVAHGDPSIFWPRGELFQLLGRTRAALEAYSLWLELEEDILALIARRTGVAGLYLLAKELLKRTMLGRTENHAVAADAHALLALVHMTWQDRDSALREATAALEFVPDHPHALTAKGIVLYQNGYFREAVSALEVALERYPANYRAMLHRAMVYERIESPEAALAAWREIPALSARATGHRCPPWILLATEDAQGRILSYAARQ
jgi:tetratricopeptide (TPR) repeat protein